MVWLLIESNVLRKIVILPSSTLKVRPSIRWFHILSFTTLPSLKMGALPPWNPGCRFNQARYRGWSYPSASPPIHSHPFAELRILSDVLLQVRQKYPQYHLGKIPFWYLQTLSLAHFSGLFHFFASGPHGRSPAQAGQKHTEFPLQTKFCTQAYSFFSNPYFSLIISGAWLLGLSIPFANRIEFTPYFVSIYSFMFLESTKHTSAFVAAIRSPNSRYFDANPPHLSLWLSIPCSDATTRNPKSLASGIIAHDPDARKLTQSYRLNAA